MGDEANWNVDTCFIHLYKNEQQSTAYWFNATVNMPLNEFMELVKTHSKTVETPQIHLTVFTLLYNVTIDGHTASDVSNTQLCVSDFNLTRIH